MQRHNVGTGLRTVCSKAGDADRRGRRSLQNLSCDIFGAAIGRPKNIDSCLLFYGIVAVAKTGLILQRGNTGNPQKVTIKGGIILVAHLCGYLGN